MTHTDDWRDSASCLSVDPNIMQPEVAAPEDIAAAIRVCDGCPVWTDCRRLAESQRSDTDDQLHGAYGVHAGEWWGPTPALPGGLPCGWCGTPVTPSKSRPRKFCSDSCRYASRDARLRAEALSA